MDVGKCLKARKIWPFPTADDGPDSDYAQKQAICREAKYKLWQSSKKIEQGAGWTLFNGTVACNTVTDVTLLCFLGVEVTTATSDDSHSESETESTTLDEVDEETDEV